MKSHSESIVWSPARSQVYNRCSLRYYIGYVLAPGGWHPDATNDEVVAYKLGHLTSLSMEVGGIVHRAIKEILTRRLQGEDVQPKIEEQKAAQLLLLFIKRSQQTDWEDLGRGTKKLVEHHTGRNLSSEQIADAMADVRSCIQGFFSNPTGRQLIENPKLLVPHMVDPDAFTKVIIEDFPLLTRTDVVARIDGATIIDWKTGRPNSSQKLSAIAQEIYVRKFLDIPPEMEVRTKFIFLQDMHDETVLPSDEEKSDFLQLAHDEVCGMREDHARIEAGDDPHAVFPPRPHPSVCNFCPYLSVCPYSKTK